jgi:hypothetical protein
LAYLLDILASKSDSLMIIRLSGRKLRLKRKVGPKLKLLLVSWKDGKNNNDFKLKLSAPIILILNISSVAEMERNVYELESGNYDFDDSEIKQRYDNQRQLNVQLQEQKHWLEHELEEVSLTQE